MAYWASLFLVGFVEDKMPQSHTPTTADISGPTQSWSACACCPSTNEVLPLPPWHAATDWGAHKTQG